MHDHQPLSTLITTFVSGILGLILGSKTRLPSILFFLFFGILLGPQFFHLIDPQVFQSNFSQYVSIAVALILFEGGLSLKSSQFHAISGALKGLLSVSVFVTFTLTTLAAYFLAGLNLEQAILFGSIMIVTGPTVVIPILHRMRIRENVHNLLKWEAILIDPLGVIVAVVLFEFLQTQGVGPLEGLLVFGARFVIGSIFGIAAGWLMYAGLTHRRMLKFEGEELGGLYVLSVTLLFYGLSESILPETGLVTVTAAGIYFGNKQFALKEHIIHFSKQITLIALSALFILLSANFPLRDLSPIMLEGFIMLAALILVIRPLSVWAGTFRDNKFSFMEKMFVAFMAPRGIVSASLATLFALQMDEKFLDGSGNFLPLAFFVIVGTILFYAISSEFFSVIMRVKEEKSSRVLIVGANAHALHFGEALRKLGVPVVFVDTNAHHCQDAVRAGFSAFMGSGFDKDFLDQLDLKGISKMIAMTANDEVNYLSCQACSFFLGKSSVYRLWNTKETWADLASPKFDESSGRPLLVPSPNSLPEITLPSTAPLGKTAPVKLPSDEKITPETYVKLGNKIPVISRSAKGILLLTPYATIPAGSEIYAVDPAALKPVD